jgi:hypothetical protein
MALTSKYRDEEQAILRPTGEITTNDLRFYPYPLPDGSIKYLPSVTTILDRAAPKHPQLLHWFKEMPKQAIEQIVRKAADEGSNVHQAIETYLMGHEVSIYCVDGMTGEQYQCYSMKEWDMICKAVAAINTLYKLDPNLKILGIELKLANPALGWAGTCDLVVEFMGQVCIIDHKTSNALSETYSQQTFAYKELVEQQLGIKVERRFILWLKAKTRTYKPEKLQGIGWQFVEHKDVDFDKDLWYQYFHIFNKKYSSDKPSIKTYPATLSMTNNIDYVGSNLTFTDSDDE